MIAVLALAGLICLVTAIPLGHVANRTRKDSR